MSLKRTGVWLLLFFFVGSAMQDKTPEYHNCQDTHVTCVIAEDCILPCSFQPSGHDAVRWFRQEVAVLSFLSAGSEEEKEDDGEDKEEDEGDEDEERGQHYDDRASVSPEQVARGNATLVLRECGPKDRGRYRCHVTTLAGVHESHVLVKVEAPLHSLHMELSRLSGFEEIKCSARHVYPAPHVTWETDPPASQLLRPITRKLADKQTGMYEVESRVRRLRHHPEITYICKVTSSYGTQSWTASLRERAEVSGPEGRDISIPCHAPDDLHDPFLSWTFTQGQDPAHILTYDRQSRSSSMSPLWEDHVQMDAYRVPLGDGSLRLLDPDHQQHTGVYTCVYSAPYRTHTEETEVTISHVADKRSSLEPSHWWIVAVVITLLVIALAAMLTYFKVKGSFSTPRKQPEPSTEMHSVKVSTPEEMIPGERSPLTVPNYGGDTTDSPSKDA
ncbi:unnamed protein product [Arctogadus glacialis]